MSSNRETRFTNVSDEKNVFAVVLMRPENGRGGQMTSVVKHQFVFVAAKTFDRMLRLVRSIDVKSVGNQFIGIHEWPFHREDRIPFEKLEETRLDADRHFVPFVQSLKNLIGRLDATQGGRRVDVIDLNALRCQFFADHFALMQAQFRQRRIENELASIFSCDHFLRQIQIQTSVGAGALVENMLEPVGAEGRIDTFAVTNDKQFLSFVRAGRRGTLTNGRQIARRLNEP